MVLLNIVAFTEFALASAIASSPSEAGFFAGFCTAAAVAAAGILLVRSRKPSEKPAIPTTREDVPSSLGAADSGRLLDAVQATLQLGVRSYDRPTRSFTYVSPKFAEIWQRDVGALGRRPDGWLECIHDADRERVCEAWSDLVDHAAAYDQKYRLCLPDGSERWIRERAYGLQDTNGAATTIVAIAEDVTIRRELEAHVRRIDRISSLGTVAAGVAHDLSDPLATIVLLSRLALHDQEDFEEKDRSLRRIRSEALRCSHIARGLLQFARDDTFEKEFAELNTTVRDAARIISEHTRESGAVVNLHLEKNLPTLRINHVAIEQILVNLLKNSCEAGAKNIDVSTGRIPDGYRLTVEDDGSGISAAAQERVFQPFYTTRAEAGGVGIGLAIVHDIVADHEGRIRLELPAKGGTRIVVEFPESLGRRDSENAVAL